jgi:hypothetical protein
VWLESHDSDVHESSVCNSFSSSEEIHARGGYRDGLLEEGERKGMEGESIMSSMHVLCCPAPRWLVAAASLGALMMPAI